MPYRHSQKHSKNKNVKRTRKTILIFNHLHLIRFIFPALARKLSFPQLAGLMDELFKYYDGSIVDFISQARCRGDNHLIKIRLAQSPFPEYPDYWHVLDNFAVKHIFMKHANEKEAQRGQIIMENEDFLFLPDILSNYDNIYIETLLGGRTLIQYSKVYPDCTRIYVEEVRRGRCELAGVTYYKQKRKLTGAKS